MKTALADHRSPGFGFQEGVAILLRNGEVRLEPVREAATRLAAEVAGVCE